MRKLTMAACAVGLAIALGTGMASAAQASSVIVVGPGHSIQAAINAARPGDTVFVRPGVYHQSVQIRKNGITLRGSGAFHGGTVLVPPKHFPKTLCNEGFGPTGVCILAKRVDPKSGAVFTPVRNDTVTGLLVTGFPGNGVFGYGTVGLKVTRVVAVNDGGYGISRFVSSRTLFADDTAIGNDEAGFYVGDSPHADTVVRNDRAFGNQFGIFIRHARHVLVSGNVVNGNCQGILVLDDGQPGGAGNAVIRHNRVFDNNKFCMKNAGHAGDHQGRRHPAARRDAHAGDAQQRDRKRRPEVQLGRHRRAERQTADPREQPRVRHDLVQLRFPQPSRGPDLGPHWNRRAVQAQPLRNVNSGRALPLS